MPGFIHLARRRLLQIYLLGGMLNIGILLSSSTIYNIFSVKNSHLDSDQVDLKAKNSRTLK